MRGAVISNAFGQSTAVMISWGKGRPCGAVCWWRCSAFILSKCLRPPARHRFYSLLPLPQAVSSRSLGAIAISPGGNISGSGGWISTSNPQKL